MLIYFQIMELGIQMELLVLYTLTRKLILQYSFTSFREMLVVLMSAHHSEV